VELTELIEKECQEALDFLEKSHVDIITNFDPKVVKIRKKKKIIISDAAARDLL
jgi:NADH/NAD ratio-sensing transcriptional regulator Rex